MPQAQGLLFAAGQLALQSILVKPKRQIGPFKAQVVFEETHVDELEITEHPIDQGARITDHAYKRPARVTIRCGWSNSPTSSNFLAGLLGAVTGTVSGIAAIISGQGLAQVNQIYANLLKLQEDRIPFDVLTGKRPYTNMLVKSLQVTTDKDSENSLMVTATFQQIIRVSVKTLTVSAPPANQQTPEATNGPTNKGTKSLEPAPNFNRQGGE